MKAPDYSYEAPYSPASHPDQLRYRTLNGTHSLTGAYRPLDVELFRWPLERRARLTLGVDGDDSTASVRAWLDADTLLKLRDAINDALVDIAAVEADRERNESFERISEEMRDAAAEGRNGCYYVHPDVHYVPAAQVQAKVEELEAAGCKRYMVLAHPVDLATGAA